MKKVDEKFINRVEAIIKIKMLRHPKRHRSHEYIIEISISKKKCVIFCQIEVK